MDRLRITAPFCGAGDLRSVAITAGIVYLIFALGGASTGFGYKTTTYGYGSYGEHYMLMILGISSVIWIISNILLIHGAVKRRHNFILPWIYWQLVFVIIALMVLIWSSVVFVEVRNSSVLRDIELRNAMIAALCCVVPFLCTVIYSSIVVYSFYRDLKGEKSKANMPDTSASRRYVTPPGSITSPRAPPVPPKTEGKDVHQQTTNIHVIPPDFSRSRRMPPTPQKTEEEHTYEYLPEITARNKPRSHAAAADEGQVYAVYDYTLPDRLPET